MSRPSMTIEPDSGWMRPRSRRRIVVFPQPLGPRITSVSPGTTVKDMSVSTRPSSKRNDTCLKSITPAHPKKIKSLVIKKSDMRIKMDEVTMACVVDRPTPTVPPSVFRPA